MEFRNLPPYSGECTAIEKSGYVEIQTLVQELHGLLFISKQ
jgi:hypothetical protein